MSETNDLSGIVEAIEQITDEKPEVILNILGCYHDLINEAVYTFGEPVTIKGFGTFYYDLPKNILSFRSNYRTIYGSL